MSMKENVRKGASPLSVLSFWWLKDLFVTGTKREITLTDLYAPLPEDRSAVVTNRLEKNWQRELNENSANPSLVRVILKTFWREFFVAGLVTVFNDFAVRLFNPLLLQTVLLFFRQDSEVTIREACYSAAGIVILGLCGVLSYNQITFTGCHNGGKIRTAVCGLVYRKTLRLSKMSSTEREKSSGHVLNLMSNDVARFDMVAVFVHWVWSAPLLVLVIAWILYQRVGWPPLIGVGIILIVVPLQCYLGMVSAKIQLRTAIKTDERLGLVAELVAGIKMIKMYAWEEWIQNRILGVREKELQMIRLSGFIRGIYMTMSVFVTRLMITATLAALCFAPTTLTMTTANVFMISSYYSVIGHAVGQMFVRGVTELAAVNVSIKRLEDYLKANESASKSKKKQPRKTGSSSEAKPAIHIEAATAYWKRQIRLIETKTMLLYKDHPPTLNNINFHLTDNLLVGIVGAVGSGKSSLVELIMGELSTDNRGEVAVTGEISYSPQESWIFHGSIRENIIYNEPWDESRYQNVLDKCNLLEDLKAMPAGDQTITGERGTVLSGGQRARVSLARAIYRRADIYLLDDPLSAVDSQVGRYLFDDIISRSGFLKNSIRLLVTHQLEYLKYVDWILVLNNGSIEIQGRPEDILGTEFKLDESKLSNRRDSMEEKPSNTCDSENMQQLEDVVVHQNSIVAKYLRQGGRTWSLVLICVLFALTQFVCSLYDAFVAYWIRVENAQWDISANATDSTITATESSHSNPLILFGCVLLIVIICLGVLRTYVFQCYSVRKSSDIHKEMLSGVLETPMRFFDTNPSGRILNKFSRDLGVMDVLLPKVILDALQMVLIIFGALAVVVLVNPWFLIPIGALFLAFRAARRVYIKSSKHLKRLDGITRSPVLTHVNSTMSGLSVIRSTNAEQKMIRQFDALQDLHTATWFLFISTTTAFCQVLDLLAVIFIGIVLLYFLLNPSVIAEEKIGLAISQAMMISGLLSWGVRQSAAVSNAFVSVERIFDLVMLPKEEKTQISLCEESLGNWPRTGQIEFSNVNYRHGEQTVLDDVNLLIRDGQKVGVVGRTGAGKSSLVNALFRLSEFDGSISIAGVDTSTIPLDILRRHISIIPQDPVLFRGTIRSNLDPFDEFSEDEIGRALADVEMSHMSLNLPVQESGNNFSVGQKQLLCLARVILRRNRILILDEATANVDPITDEMIQKTIRRRFRECTVISIAHRINTVEDADYLVVMDRGRICDVGPPPILNHSLS